MSLKIIFGSILSIVGTLSALLGLMFFLATGNKSSHIIVGTILLIAQLSVGPSTCKSLR